MVILMTAQEAPLSPKSMDKKTKPQRVTAWVSFPPQSIKQTMRLEYVNMPLLNETCNIIVSGVSWLS